MSKDKVLHNAKLNETVVESDKKVIEVEVVWDCGSPLYDSYELASVSHLIERHLMIFPFVGGSKRFKLQHHHHQHQQHRQINHIYTSKVVIDSNKPSEVKEEEHKVFGSSLIGCMGSYSFWRKIRGGKVMKIKFNKFRPLGIKWFM